MFPIIELGPFSVQSAGLILLLGLWIGVSYTVRWCNSHHLPAEQIENLIWVILISGLVGARLSFALKSISVFLSNPLQIFSVQASMMDISGGLVFIFLSGWIFIQRKQIAIWDALFGMVPFFNILLISYFLEGFASGNIYNRLDILSIFGVFSPFQEYIAPIIAAILFFILMVAMNWRTANHETEELSEDYKERFVLLFVFLAAFIILLLDYFLGNPETISTGLGGIYIHKTQIITILIMLIAAGLLRRTFKSIVEA